MARLTKGGGLIPEPWGYPSQVWVRGGWFRRGQWKSGGFVFNGGQAATEEDIRRLQDWATKTIGRRVGVDEGTLVGRASKKYSTFAQRNHVVQRIRL